MQKHSINIAWAQLVRLPNLLTVPGDPLAGYLLIASIGGVTTPINAAICCAAAIFLYAAGLIANDCLDLAEDRRERPWRPIASGQVKLHQAWPTAVILAGCGLGIASLAGTWPALCAAALIVSIALYNGGTKRVPILGPLTMGLCRALSLIMGAAAASPADVVHPVILIAAGTLLIYIAAVTQIASNETHSIRIGLRRWGPTVILAIGYPALYLVALSYRPESANGPTTDIMFAIGGLLTLAVTARCARRLQGVPNPETVSRTIGSFLRALLLVQATFAALLPFPGAVVAACLTVAWLASGKPGDLLYAS